MLILNQEDSEKGCANARFFKLILCYLVGDYLFQTPYLAETKGSNWYHLFVHCMLYALPFYLCFGWCWQLAVVAGLHFPIDLAKARYHKIGALTDQLMHYGLVWCI